MPTMQITELDVKCPYCGKGGCKAYIHHKGGADELQGVKEPHKCNLCGRFFTLGIRMHVFGKPIQSPGEPNNKEQVIRSILEGG